MTRRSKELILLAIVTVIFCIFDPLKLAVQGTEAKYVYSAVVYLIPSAVITVMLLNIIYKIKK